MRGERPSHHGGYERFCRLKACQSLAQANGMGTPCEGTRPEPRVEREEAGTAPLALTGLKFDCASFCPRPLAWAAVLQAFSLLG